MKKQIVYTESAKEKLNLKISNFIQSLEAELIEEKNYPGEDTIEITASDIERMFEKVRFSRSHQPSNLFRTTLKLAAPVYFILGILVMIYGLFYYDIRLIIANDPKRTQILLIGLILSVFSGIAYLLNKQREIEQRKKEKELNENERLNIN